MGYFFVKVLNDVVFLINYYLKLGYLLFSFEVSRLFVFEFRILVRDFNLKLLNLTSESLNLGLLRLEFIFKIVCNSTHILIEDRLVS